MPLYYLAYELGAYVLRVPAFSFDQFSALFSIEKFLQLGAPFLVGCAILMHVGGVLGYFGVHYLWRRSVLHQLELRKFRDAELNSAIMARESYRTYRKFLEHCYKHREEGRRPSRT